MPAPLVVDVLRDQLLEVLAWKHGPNHPKLRWGVAIHRRNERGRLRFGAVTPAGESLLLSGPLIEGLRLIPCWLDGAVPVRLEGRKLADADAVDIPGRLPRARLVEELAVYFDPDATADASFGFKQMAGVLTPATLPSDLFVLTRERPAAWPR